MYTTCQLHVNAGINVPYIDSIESIRLCHRRVFFGLLLCKSLPETVSNSSCLDETCVIAALKHAGSNRADPGSQIRTDGSIEDLKLRSKLGSTPGRNPGLQR